MLTYSQLVKQAAAVYRIEDLEVREVSVVDKGANLRKLLLVKNAEGTASDPVVEAQAARAEETTELAVSLPEAVRDELADMLSNVSSRLGALGEAVKAAKPGEGTISDHFKDEVVGLGNMLRRLGGIDKTKEVSSIDLALLKANAPLNSRCLPTAMLGKSSIAYVMTPEGPLMKMSPDDMREVVIQFALYEMYSAIDTLSVGDYQATSTHLYDVMKTIMPFMPAPEAPQMLMQADDIASTGAATPVEKKHKQFTPSRASRLEAVQLALAELLAELKSQNNASTPAEASQPEPPRVPQELQVQLKQMVGMIKSLQAENKTLKSSRPLGNASANDGFGTQPTTAKIFWPDDLNDLSDPDTNA